MLVHRDFETDAAADEADLAADVAHGIDIDIGVRMDPGHSRAHAKTLSGDRHRWHQQGDHREQRAETVTHERAQREDISLLSAAPLQKFSGPRNIDAEWQGSRTCQFGSLVYYQR